MYRLLEVGEVIEKGDEIWSRAAGWFSAEMSIGENVPTWAAPMRRLVKGCKKAAPAITPAASSVPDPGEGYRLIDKAVDKPEPGDEYWSDQLKSWETRCFGVRDTSRFTSRDTYRRKLPAVPSPVVSVGDRVKVLSGPWAGCTGVVAYFQVEATMSGFSLLTARENSKPAVLLENVFVGGNRLMVAVAGNEVEPLPPVVPEVLYRDLSHGDIVKAGDQFWSFGYGPWVDAGPEEFGGKIGGFKARHRRPVRLQSPGWRYLDAGETVQAGDETAFNTGDPWRSAAKYFTLPYVVMSQEAPSESFRRKLPANQGG